MLTDGLGLDRDYVISRKGALPATKFAVEAYVNFVREKTLVEAVASSLTELFAPKIHKERISGMLENYDFISDDVMQYFKRRLTQAPRRRGLRARLCEAERAHARGASRRLDALRFKCNVLWSQLDALYLAYYEPGMIPPDAFVPGKA